MTTVAPAADLVNPMTPMSDLSARLKRDVAFNRAAQLLANATACRNQEAPRNLSAMLPIEREWFKQTSRQLIEIFEQMTVEREPDAVVDQRDLEAQRLELALHQARAARLSIERQQGRLGAAERGHDLGAWHEEIGVDGEIAACRRCHRRVDINLAADPALSGPALTEGCLVAAAQEDL